VPGRPALYATTRRFLDYFGLRSLNDLPTLAEIRDPAFFGDELDLEGAVVPEQDMPPPAKVAAPTPLDETEVADAANDNETEPASDDDAHDRPA
jgi:segregation and condensation protein B